MKRFLLIISGLTLISTSINSFSILAKNDSGGNQTSDSSKKFKSYSKVVKLVRTRQETNYYCVPAAVQSLFLTLGAPQGRYNQRAIFDYFGQFNPYQREGVGLYFDQHLIDYINNNIRRFNPEVASRYIFSLTETNNSIGNNEEEALLFQNFIISNLSENIPVLFASSLENNEPSHALVIRGIQTAENPLNTRYWYLDPWTGEYIHHFDGSDLVAMTRRGLHVIGVNGNNFDFSKKEIKIKIAEEKFEKKLQMGIPETVATQVNLTQEAGISSLSSIQKFNKINLNNYSNQISWKDQNKTFKEETWYTKYFWMNNTLDWHILGSQTINNEDLAYKTEYSSVLWSNYSGDLMLTLRYKFQLNAESGSDFDVKNNLTLGNIITLTF